MRIGAHVRAGKGLVPALQHGADIGAEVVQIFTQSPRMWKPSQYGPEVLAGYRAAQAEHPTVKATFCHATYLINLATPDAELASKSRACLNANLATAEGMGADGLVLHIGSHRGTGFDAALPAIASALLEALDSVGEMSPRAPGANGTGGAGGGDDRDDEEAASCPILLENAAGAGDTVGRSFEELAEVIDMADGDERLGVCLDTQHLWASGIPFTTIEDADALMTLVDRTVGLGRLRCLHLNDSKVGFGANRDRHENIGAGTIGSDGLSALIGHPDLQGLSAILEVPGAGDGPRVEDIAAARAVWEHGLDMRSGAATRAPGPAKRTPVPAARVPGAASGAKAAKGPTAAAKGAKPAAQGTKAAATRGAAKRTGSPKPTKTVRSAKGTKVARPAKTAKPPAKVAKVAKPPTKTAKVGKARTKVAKVGKAPKVAKVATGTKAAKAARATKARTATRGRAR